VVKIQQTRSHKVQTVHVDRPAPYHLPPPPVEPETSPKQPVEPERRSTRLRKPPSYLASYS